jgi:hypothetical protein
VHDRLPRLPTYLLIDVPMATIDHECRPALTLQIDAVHISEPSGVGHYRYIVDSALSPVSDATIDHIEPAHRIFQCRTNMNKDSTER